MTKEDLPLVTIVTPSFNQGNYIEETIQSVITQDYPNIEYIIVDGGSTDNTISIIQNYEAFISKWISEKDNGQSDAINKGWRMANGKIVAWLNSDDLYVPGTIQNVVDALQANPDAGMVYGNAFKIDINSNILGLHHSNHQRNYIKGDPIAHDIAQPTTFIRKNLLQQSGFLNTDLHYCMDYDLFFRISNKTNIIYVPQVLAKMRLYQGTKSSQNLGINMQEKVAVLKQYHPTWYFSKYWWVYIRYMYFWQYLPKSIQSKIRQIRSLPRDQIL